MAPLKIEAGTLDQAETVASLIHALLDELSGGEPQARDGLLQTAEAVLAAETVIVAIARWDNRPVGVMTLNSCMAIYAGGHFGEISELYIVPDMRSKGIARHLLDFAIREGHSRSWRRIEVGAPSQPAWKRSLVFYLANGFEETGPRLRRLL